MSGEGRAQLITRWLQGRLEGGEGAGAHGVEAGGGAEPQAGGVRLVVSYHVHLHYGCCCCCITVCIAPSKV